MSLLSSSSSSSSSPNTAAAVFSAQARFARPAAAPTPSRRWLILPTIGALLLIGMGGLLYYYNQPTVTVAEVRSELREIALRRSDRGGLDHGGAIGPWWVSATRVNPYTDEFEDFRVRSGNMLIAARSAHLKVNAEQNTFSFELSDVVFTRIMQDEQLAGGDALWELERHTLGPAPYRANIVPDPAGRETDVPAFESLVRN